MTVHNADINVYVNEMKIIGPRARRYCCRSWRSSGNGLNGFRNCVAAPNASLEARVRITDDNDDTGIPRGIGVTHLLRRTAR